MSLRLRQRDHRVLDFYDPQGRIIAADSLGVVDHAARRWHDARHAGGSLLIVAADHQTVSATNDTVRTARIHAGEVEAEGVELAGQVVGVGDEASTAGWIRPSRG